MESEQLKVSAGTINGPLTIHKDNPRYFADLHGNPVYLTGSHNWSNIQEHFTSDPGKEFDYSAHLKWLQSFGHNYTRGWHWETTTWNGFNKNLEVLTPIRPLPYARTGPGQAIDGKPKFDLTVHNQEYFDRLRQRVIQAGEHGIYMSVMLFEGFSVDCRAPFPTRNPWDGHPYNAANNVNGIDGSGGNPSGGRLAHTLGIPEMTRLQEAYVRKVIDTVNDLDNVLYEIGNEHYEDSYDWQCYLVSFINDYERSKPKQHPVGMTSGGGSPDAVTNDQLFNSPADWISPRQNMEKRAAPYQEDPPAGDGTKVIVADTDHIGGLWGTVPWAWKSFTRGLNLALMDPYEPLHGLDDYVDQGWGQLNDRNHPLWEPIRRNMGYTRYFAEKMDLAKSLPHSELASTNFCLARYGREYLVYAPEGKEVTVDLGSEGTFQATWLDPDQGTLVHGDTVAASRDAKPAAPFGGHTVLHLRRNQ